jgi:hypothetical protein
MVLNYITYSVLFIKLWGLNKILFGIPFYLIEKFVLSNVITLTYQGGKYVIYGVGNYVFPEPIIVNNVKDETKRQD